jgi:hypothetical protein
MGVSTFVIGLLPTVAVIGWVAPIVLIAVGRSVTAVD